MAAPWLLQSAAAVGAGLLAIAAVLVAGPLLYNGAFAYAFLGGWLGAVVATWLADLRQLVRDRARVEGAVSGRLVASSVLALALAMTGVLAVHGGASTHPLAAVLAGACAATWAAMAGGEAIARRIA